MTHWANYYKERFGRDSIEEDWGFISFTLNPPICVLEDIYVVPEHRRKYMGDEILGRLEVLAKQNKCSKMIAQIWANDTGAHNTIRAAIAVGFRIQNADNGRIIISKEIGE